jgi:glycyl-tRNA synthetase beta chain
MADFLLELLSEEIPARMQEKASTDLARLFTEELAKAGLKPESITSFVTPRRLALIARGLPLETAAVSEERKGPRADAPEQALAGFLKSSGLTRDQLVERADAKGNIVLFAVIEKPGRATAAVLAEAIPTIIRAFPWPKSMRWGTASASTASLRWVRPLQSIVALLGDDVVPIEIDGVTSGSATVGHRFHHPGMITIGNADDYAAKLRACHVIVDAGERRQIIRDGAAKAAAAVGLTVVPDEGLVAENAGLTEWPVPLLGAFDPAFLTVPREVIQLTMRTNQKYFACLDAAGALAPNFICTANIVATDGGVGIVAGNRKVLVARLSDAKFFWEQDLKVPLADSAKKLDQIVFHEKLGTVADKVDRVAKLAQWLVKEGIVPPKNVIPAKAGIHTRNDATGNTTSGNMDSRLRGNDDGGVDRALLADMAEQAARLCKADLVTGMVGEFPELQGVMGGYYARAEGLSDAVADAIRDHYKPVGQGDEVPIAPVTVAVSLADKLDTLVSFFAIGQRPTGSKDPFALRRASIAIIKLIVENELRCGLSDLVREARNLLISSLGRHDAIVAFNDETSFGVAVPVQPAHAERTTAGAVVIVSWDAEAEKEVNLSGTSYPAFSRDYIDRSGLAIVEIGSLTEVVGTLVQYITDRIAEAQKSDGMRTDLIRAVVPREFITLDLLSGLSNDVPARAKGPGVHRVRMRNWSQTDDTVEILTRVKSLQSFIETPDGADLLAGYKRAANILKKEDKEMPAFAGMTDLGYVPEPAEAALIAALEKAEPQAMAAIASEDFAAAMTALATLRAPIDAFFNEVTVNDPDPKKRSTRLAILEKIRAAVHNVADFSKIEG